MKKTRLIAAICLIAFAASIQAQSITPIQLKEARMAVYKWYYDYMDRGSYSSRYDAKEDFISLFENDNIRISDDLIFHTDFDFNTQSITVAEYAKRLFDENATYIPACKYNDLVIAQETLQDGKILYQLDFTKTFSAAEKDVYTDDRRAYPSKEFAISCYLSYDIESKTIFATDIVSKPIEEFIIFKEGKTYQYSTEEQVSQEASKRATPLISQRVIADNIDNKIHSISADTLKFNVHFGPSIGTSLFTTAYDESNISKFKRNAGIDVGINIGIYFQLRLQEKNRWGLELSPTIKLSKLSVNCDYQTNYASIDPDGGQYIRQVRMTGYEESINRFHVDLPVGARYDYFVKNDLSVFTRFGVSLSYDFAQKLKGTGSVEYAGYYDWLYNVTINQNGIYDFGTFDFYHTSNASAFHRLGISAFAGIGVQYFIPNSKWSVEGALHYSNMFYNPTNPMADYQLSDNISDWHSITNLFNRFNSQQLSIQINFNRNF